MDEPRQIILTNGCSPGDVMVLTAAVRDLHRAYPRQYRTKVQTSHPELWEHNPFVADFEEDDQTLHIDCGHPPMIDRCAMPVGHYVTSMHELLGARLGRRVPVRFAGPDLHLTPREMSRPPCGVRPPYWVIIAGGKRDFTIKWWPSLYYQQLVDAYRGRIRFVQAGAEHDHHPPLEGVINLVGRTSLRELMQLIYHADGVVCPVTCAMHIAAAFAKPCVVISGGREPSHWVQYPGHQVLHTIGQLSCCERTGCWRARIEPLGDGGRHDASLCDRPTPVNGGRYAACMSMIEPAEVAGMIDRYRAFPRNGAELTPTNVVRQVERACAGLPAYPGGYEGRGIVIPGGGEKYFPCAWVCVHMLRRLGCTLPIELWHLGEQEIDARRRELIEPLGVTCVDAHEVRLRHPARRLSGWELKPFAAMHSRFREVLFLDADNVPIVDPTFLFDTPQYERSGALFWPDHGHLRPSPQVWRMCGLDYRDEPDFETGQMVIDKRRCWRPLALTMWMNEHSDFWYRHIHGDKDTFHLAWRRLHAPYAMPDTPMHMLPFTMCQHDFTGRRIFQHRNLRKWSLLDDDARILGFEMESECLAILDRLRAELAPQRSRAHTSPPAAEREALTELLCRDRWLYRRVGHDGRVIGLTRDGRIAEGAAECEAGWELRLEDGQPTLLLLGRDGVTCRLTTEDRRTWRGRWLRHERMPIELIIHRKSSSLASD